ncbi:DNA helicase II [Pseudomonas phage phiPto-bp6g]|nr:DNA helicase II [Pseudomonas phage phiPto-bp6g]
MNDDTPLLSRRQHFYKVFIPLRFDMFNQFFQLNDTLRTISTRPLVRAVIPCVFGFVRLIAVRSWVRMFYRVVIVPAVGRHNPNNVILDTVHFVVTGTRWAAVTDIITDTQLRVKPFPRTIFTIELSTLKHGCKCLDRVTLVHGVTVIRCRILGCGGIQVCNWCEVFNIQTNIFKFATYRCEVWLR